LRQSIEQRWNAVSIVYLPASVIGVRAFLLKRLVALAVLKGETAIGFLKLVTLDNQNRAPVFVVVLKFRDNNFRLVVMILTIALGQWPGQRSARGVEVDAV
jgi:hypothetical protein